MLASLVMLAEMNDYTILCHYLKPADLINITHHLVTSIPLKTNVHYLAGPVGLMDNTVSLTQKGGIRKKAEDSEVAPSSFQHVSRNLKMAFHWVHYTVN